MTTAPVKSCVTIFEAATRGLTIVVVKEVGVVTPKLLVFCVAA